MIISRPHGAGLRRAHRSPAAAPTAPPLSLPASHLIAAVITVFTGALAFCVLGCVITVVIRRATAAMPLLFGVTLALFFLSGNFFPTDTLSVAWRAVANVFPVRHFLTAMLTAYNPT
jgi:ABC-2 type transport system permease protein